MLSFDKISLFLFVVRNEYFATVQGVSDGYPKVIFAEPTFSIGFLPTHFPYLFRIEVLGSDLFKCPIQMGGFKVMLGNEFLFALSCLIDISQRSSTHIPSLFFSPAHSVKDI